MIFSRADEYAIRAMTFLAKQPAGRLVGAREISEAEEIPMELRLRARRTWQGQFPHPGCFGASEASPNDTTSQHARPQPLRHQLDPRHADARYCPRSKPVPSARGAARPRRRAPRAPSSSRGRRRPSRPRRRCRAGLSRRDQIPHPPASKNRSRRREVPAGERSPSRKDSAG